MKSVTTHQWRELAEGFLLDGPPKRADYEAVMFVNKVEVRKPPKGKTYLERSCGIVPLRGSTQDEADEKVSDFADLPDVRRLIAGLDANDFERLPSRVTEPPANIIDGTAEIYQPRAAKPPSTEGGRDS